MTGTINCSGRSFNVEGVFNATAQDYAEYEKNMKLISPLPLRVLIPTLAELFPNLKKTS